MKHETVLYQQQQKMRESSCRLVNSLVPICHTKTQTQTQRKHTKASEVKTLGANQSKEPCLHEEKEINAGWLMFQT